MKVPDWKLWLDNMEECKKWFEKYQFQKILRKSEDDSKLYLKKAEHNLNFANWIKEKHKNEIKGIFKEETFYDWVVNIYYYAIYHASLALISRGGFESKNHSASLCFLIYNNFHLNKSINKEDIHLIASSLSKEEIEILGNSKELRERAAYNVHESFEEKIANRLQEQTINFLNRIRIILGV